MSTTYLLTRHDARPLYGSAREIAYRLLGIDYQSQVAPELLADTIREVEYHAVEVAPLAQKWIHVAYRVGAVAHNRRAYASVRHSPTT